MLKIFIRNHIEVIYMLIELIKNIKKINEIERFDCIEKSFLLLQSDLMSSQFEFWSKIRLETLTLTIASTETFNDVHNGVRRILSRGQANVNFNLPTKRFFI